MVDSSSADLLAELDAKQKRWRIWPWVLGASVFLASPALNSLPNIDTLGRVIAAIVLVSCAYLIWLASRLDALRRTTVLFFNVDDERVADYQALHDAFDGLAAAAGKWHIEAKGATNDQKRHAGASHLIRRQSLTFSDSPPGQVKTNVAVPVIRTKQRQLCFFPDRLLVFATNSVGAIDYSSLTIDIVAARFIESDPVPNDARVVGQTWKYVNKGGEPDKRFKDNRQIPVVLYEELHLGSSSGLNELIQLSRVGLGERFRTAVMKWGEAVRSQGVHATHSSAAASQSASGPRG